MMGHYASEMGPPPVRFDPDVLLRRRQEAQEHAAYVWNLYERYEQQGEWIRESTMLTCPRCFCQVSALLRADHEQTHG